MATPGGGPRRPRCPGRRTGRFRKSDRLLRSEEFQHVTRQGRRAASSAFVVLVLRGGADEPPRLGLTVSRKVGNAVARNRVKRRIREWFRHEREQIGTGVEVVVIARPEAAMLGAEEGSRALSVLVAKAARR